MKTIPTITELQDEILADIESGTGQTTPVLAKALFRVLSKVLGGILHLAYRFGLWIYKQILTITMDEEALLNRCREYGITRTAATTWAGTATATGDDDTVIPVGFLFQINGQVYSVTTEATISGSTTISLESLETGEDIGLDNGTILKAVTPLAGLDAEATVASTTQTAEDEETIDALRARLLFRQQNQPQGGAAPDYVVWALEISGIGEAYAFRPTAGSPNVNVYPLLSVTDPADRIPGATKLTEVEDYISHDSRKPFGAVPSALAFDELDFDVDIADLSPNTTAIKTAIESAIETYLYARRPKQYEDEVNPKSVISAAAITKVAFDAGADICTVDLKNAGGSSITDYELEDDELAVLRTLTWV